jgi:hypothetical protein
MNFTGNSSNVQPGWRVRSCFQAHTTLVLMFAGSGAGAARARSTLDKLCIQ